MVYIVTAQLSEPCFGIRYAKTRDAQHESVLRKGVHRQFCRNFGGEEVNTSWRVKFVPVMAILTQRPAPPAGALRRRRDPPSPSRLLVPHVMAQVTSVPAVGQTAGSRHRQDDDGRFHVRNRESRYSHDRIRSCTYPSLEMNGSISLCVLTHIEVQVRFLLSPLLANAPLSRVEHCHSNRRRLPLVGHQEGVGGIVATWKAMIEKSHAARLHCAPCTCHGDFFKIRGSRDSLAPWLPARTSRTACSLSRAPASASCVEAGASSFFST